MLIFNRMHDMRVENGKLWVLDCMICELNCVFFFCGRGNN